MELGDLATVYHKAKQKPSFTRVREPEIVSMASAFDFSDFATPLKDLPEVNTEEYTDEELGRELFFAQV